MLSIFRHIILLVISFFIFSACNEGSVTQMPEGHPEVPGEEQKQKSETEDFHVVSVNEILETSKYMYLNVTEGQNQFWIATIKSDVSVGETYMYKGGFVKVNFISKELDREFDQVYFVDKIIGKNGHTPEELASHSAETSNTEEVNEESKSSTKVVLLEGSKTIADVIANASKYEGKTVQITGKCVKLNTGIMGVNWIHLQDGSKDDYDLIVTSDVVVPVGHIVTMTATVALNKDYGAGYKYDVILENGVVIDSSDYQ